MDTTLHTDHEPHGHNDYDTLSVRYGLSGSQLIIQCRCSFDPK